MGSKHKCRWKTNKDGKPITEKGQRVLQCKIDGEGPVTAHPKDGKDNYNFVPEGEIDSDKETEAIKYMKIRLGVTDSEGKTGEW